MKSMNLTANYIFLRFLGERDKGKLFSYAEEKSLASLRENREKERKIRGKIVIMNSLEI